MRKIYTYNITSIDKLIYNLLFLSKKQTHISLLLSNHNELECKLPMYYMNYDAICGIGKKKGIKVDADSLLELRNFHNRYNDWMFGYLSYDLKNEIEDLGSYNNDKLASNNLSFFIPKYVLLLKKGILEVLTHESKEDVDLLLKDHNNLVVTKKNKVNLTPQETKEEYINKIIKIKRHIQDGDIYEMNYCLNYFSDNVDLDPETIFKKLNDLSRNPFSAFMKIDEQCVISSSPERYLKKINNKLISQPIKGSIKRGRDNKEDSYYLNKLKFNKKDIIENVMIVDLVRNDLSKTADQKNVNVDELCKVYSFHNIHQMISTISSRTSDKTHFTDILESTFPMGSMTGVPKIKAMDLIDKYEEFRRGIFSGSIGYITPEGDFDFNVVIRTILYNSCNKYLSVSAGGAITIKSDPEEEYEECKLKMKPIVDILNN